MIRVRDRESEGWQAEIEEGNADKEAVMGKGSGRQGRKKNKREDE